MEKAIQEKLEELKRMLARVGIADLELTGREPSAIFSLEGLTVCDQLVLILAAKTPNCLQVDSRSFSQEGLDWTADLLNRFQNIYQVTDEFRKLSVQDQIEFRRDVGRVIRHLEGAIQVRDTHTDPNGTVMMLPETEETPEDPSD